MARGGISDYYDDYQPRNEKEGEVVNIIPSTTRLTGTELAKIDFDFLHSNINLTPRSVEFPYDELDATAYLRYYNDLGTNFFVVSFNPDYKVNDKNQWGENTGNRIPVGEFYGYMFDADNSELTGTKYFALPDLLQEYGDELANFKLDYDFTPQTINGGLALAGFKQFQSRDVKPIGKTYQDLDVESIVLTNYKSYIERNSAIMNLIGYLGLDGNEYDFDTKNFIANYTCEDFRSIRSNKLSKVSVGMIFQGILDKDIEINNCIIFGDCAGRLCQNFEPNVMVTGIDDDKISKDVAEILYGDENHTFMTSRQLSLNEPENQMDSSIIYSTDINTAINNMTYVKPNGIIVLLCFVNDFEDYFSVEEHRKQFLLRYEIQSKYRISTENLLLHINKIQN